MILTLACATRLAQPARTALVRIVTEMGEIDVEVDLADAPATSAWPSCRPGAFAEGRRVYDAWHG